MEARRLLTVSINEFGGTATLSEPVGITTGPDGNLWFTEANASRGAIGRITPSGAIEQFSSGLTPGSAPTGITSGPDGKLWFTESAVDKIGQIDTSGTVAEFAIPTPASSPDQITVGPDGALWFTENGNGSNAAGIGRITPQGVVTEFRAGLSSGAAPISIAAGPDGDLWFTADTPTGGEIGRIMPPSPLVPNPVIAEFAIPANGAEGTTSSPTGIVKGFNDALWFGDRGNHAIGEITTAGVIQEFTAGLSLGDVPDQITTGPDGNYWFSDPTVQGDPIGQITPSGIITLFQTPTPAAGPMGIVTGPDNNLWFTEYAANQIGQLVLPQSITNAAGTPATAIATTPASFTVATFDDSSTATNAANFTATIDYGDGSTGPGTILPLNTPGDFEVIGTHRYATVGQFTASITIGTASGTIAPVTAPITATSPLDLTGSPIQGLALVRANTLVATFTDADMSAAAFDFTATVSWGDGSTDPSARVVEMNSGTTSFFAVYDGHTYSAPGSFPLTLSITDRSNGLSATAGPSGGFVATVSGPPTDKIFNELGPSELTPGAGPNQVTEGPDGAVWFTETNIGAIGRVDTSGQVTEFVPPRPAVPIPIVNGLPTGITSGPDGNLWFAEAGSSSIGQLTPQGLFTMFSGGITPGSQPFGITSGPDGNLWFTEAAGDRIGRITPQGVVTEFSAGLTSGFVPESIATGPDGNLWFTGAGSNLIGRITPQGVITEFSGASGIGLTSITPGPDHALWFTEQGSNQIGRIDPDTFRVAEFAGGLGGPTGITTGPDGNLWFTDSIGASGGATAEIGRITPQGAITLFSTGLTPQGRPAGIVAGQDGNLYFAETAGDRIGQVILPQTSLNSPTVEANLPSPAQGDPFSTALATFRDNSAVADLTNFRATIDWGDGSSSAGTVTESSDGLFTVSGTHAYASPGVFPGTILIGNEANSASPLPFSITVETTSLQVTGLDFTTQANRAFSGPVAVLADSFGPRPSGDYRATIDWGDDTTSAGTLQVGPNGPDFVIGTHTYATSGTFTVTTTVHVIASPGNSNSGTTVATVTPFVSRLAATGVVVTATQDALFGGVVANFTDSSAGNAPISDQVVATIDWGDRTSRTSGVIQQTATGSYQVIGSHIYASSGRFAIKVFLARVNGPDTANASSDAVVTAATPISFTVTNTNDSGPGSLRQAILNADLFPGHTIDFAIPSGGVSRISPIEPLPDLSSLTVIDGFSQATFEGKPFASPLVEVDGRAVGGTSPGLLFDGTSAGSDLEGISIFGFNGPQVVLDSIGDILWGNFVGLAADGTIPATLPTLSATVVTPSDGVLVLAPNATIGGLAPGQRNVISGTTGQGIDISGPRATSAHVIGNILGLDPTGTAARPNALDGIAIDQGAGRAIIGPGNLISGNGIDGIILLGSTEDSIVGNAIGTDLSGNRAIGNGIDGVDADQDSSGVAVGGTALGESNIVSGNGSVGIALQLGSTGNQVLFNLIGTNIEGNAALGNGIAGVLISDSPANIVGPGNVISGNGVVSSGAGIWIDGTGSSGNLVFANEVGTNIAGEDAIGNAVIGILIDDASGNTIGGSVAGTANVISGNTVIGVMIAGPDASQNLVIGNLIGTDARGVRAVGNGSGTTGDGVYIDDAPGNSIGGASPTMANLISGNLHDGIQVFGPNSVGNLIQGNKVGTDIFGTHRLGNGDDGLVINGAPGTRIVGNVLSANARNGITVSDTASTRTRIQGNAIGQGIGGKPLGNGNFGIVIINAAPEPSDIGNIIVHNSLGPIRDTNLATAGSNPPSTGPATYAHPSTTNPKARKVARKVQPKARPFRARSLSALQGRGQAKLKDHG